MTTAAATDLCSMAAHLRPDLDREIWRLYAAERELEDLKREHVDVVRQLHAASVVVGDLRQRLVRAENRLEDLNVDAITKAKHSALFLGVGFVRLTSLGRGRYSTEHIHSDRVIVRG